MGPSREYLRRKEKEKYGYEIGISNDDRTSLRRTLAGMYHRCYVEEDKFYRSYGGRGVEISTDWYDSESMKLNYAGFIVWALNSGWKKEYQIDRIDNNKGYSPENCRWVTPKENCNNRRSNRILEKDGERHTMSEWADILGMSYKAIEHRINRGMSDKEALTRPVTKGQETLVTYNGVTQNMSQWAESVGLKPAAFIKRIREGWSFEKALTSGNATYLNARRYTYNGETHTAKEWAGLTGIKYNKLRVRIRKFGIEQAIVGALKSKKEEHGKAA